MAEIKQNDLEYLKDQMAVHGMTVDQANVQLVKMKRVRMVLGSVPASVRKALNAAVKTGELAHMKKDVNKPEVYYHPTFEYLAIAERNAHANSVKRAVMGICV